MSKLFRIGQIVPSSNTTMETGIPAMLRAREALRPERFTCHSSRMRMHRVTPEELVAMSCSLTDLVVKYIENEGIEVVDALSFEIPDNLEVGRRDPAQLIEDVKRLNTANVDVVVLSACVQMPSLQSIQTVEDRLGIPVTSTAVCTTRRMLDHLGHEGLVGKLCRTAQARALQARERLHHSRPVGHDLAGLQDPHSCCAQWRAPEHQQREARGPRSRQDLQGALAGRPALPGPGRKLSGALLPVGERQEHRVAVLTRRR